MIEEARTTKVVEGKDRGFVTCQPPQRGNRLLSGLRSSLLRRGTMPAQSSHEIPHPFALTLTAENGMLPEKSKEFDTALFNV